MRFSFGLKLAIVATLVVLFDRLFPDSFSGARIGAFASIWLAGLAMGRTDVRRSRPAWIALSVAVLFAASLFDDPGPLAWTLYWCALSVAALIPRSVGFDDAWHWGARLLIHAVAGLGMPFVDLRRFGRPRRSRRLSPGAITAMLGLPLAGGALFLALFAAANPLISQALEAIQLPSIWQILLWAFVAVCVWPSLRPHPAVMRLAGRLPNPEPVLPGTSLPSVLIALVMALAMLRSGSASERHPWARRLVALWVAQNLVLVASSVLRTIEYIEASMLTAWRIAALAWMGLVALGLVLICWRILTGRSGRWLINWNALAAAVVLAVCSFVDLGAIAASWNTSMQAPAKVDLCYLDQVGDGALLPLIALESRPMDAVTRDRVRYVRDQRLVDLKNRQSSWATWTSRGARRLAQAQAILGPSPARPLPMSGPAWRNCDGSIGHPVPPSAQP